jgi:hypothetical protein
VGHADKETKNSEGEGSVYKGSPSMKGKNGGSSNFLNYKMNAATASNRKNGESLKSGSSHNSSSTSRKQHLVIPNKNASKTYNNQ